MGKYDYLIAGLWCGGALGIIICSISVRNHPSAMDVYRGKTTLEITYKDNVPVDSVVVFKDKVK